MKKLLILILLSLSVIIYSQDTYVEEPISFGSAKVLGMGNTYVAKASGLESFEFNPAGISEDNSFTILSGNMNMIANYFLLADDLIDVFNDDTNNEHAEEFFDTELSYFLDPLNRDAVITALLNQVHTPYGDQLYANGLGFGSSISTGFTLGGIGVGLLVNLDSEVFGEQLSTAETNNVLTTALLLGYSLEIDLGIIGVSAGISARPMYKVRSTTDVSAVADVFNVDETTKEDDMDLSFLENISYLTGVGVGVDAGIKAHAFGLTAGIAVMDLMGTRIFYSENSYTDIMEGNFLGSSEVTDEYVTPPSLKLGLAFNPMLGSFNNVLNPTVALDYNLLFVDSATVQEYAYQGSFWKNLSLGAEIELFNLIALRGGLNQGYATLGFGFDLFVVELDAAVYSRELGEDVGERQQMGAVIEFAVRI